MLQSKLFGKTTRDDPSDEVSVNAKLLARAGFIDKLMAGTYSFLPLGFRVLKKVEQIIREEMNAVGGQEILLPALHPKENWDTTGRWKDPGREVMFQLKGRGDREYGLGWTHEEIVTPLAKRFITSYRDLPLAVYQIQDKFRDEPRAKSGLLRGREFIMKDMYSFHGSADDLAAYYARVRDAYVKIFKRLGLDAIVVEASGGAFSKYSHEFQVVTPAGEDIIFQCDRCEFAQNREITKIQAGDKCTRCKKGKIHAQRAIEVGNIFELKTRFSEAFQLAYKGEDGANHYPFMGCYGIGLGRIVGAVVEVQHDEAGIIWPVNIAPYRVHLIALQNSKVVRESADKLYQFLQAANIEVLYDDRVEPSAGEKFADADLIGLPLRLVVSEKTTGDEVVEVKRRGGKEIERVKQNRILEICKNA